MLIWLVFGFLSGRGVQDVNNRYMMWGGSFLLFILLVLLGWEVFDAPVHK